MSSLPTVLITGANQGLGFEAASQLALSGKWHVLLGSRNTSKGEAAKAKIGSSDATIASRITVVTLDITSDESVAAAAETVRSQFGGRLDVLINNAGKGQGDGATLREQYRDILDLNVASQAIMTEAFLPLLKASTYPGKRVVFVTSTVGCLTYASDPTHKYYHVPYFMYRSSKSCLNLVALHYARTLKSDGISSVLVCPGWCKTAFSGGDGDTEPADGAKNIVKAATEGDNKEMNTKWIDADGDVPW